MSATIASGDALALTRVECRVSGDWPRPTGSSQSTLIVRQLELMVAQFAFELWSSAAAVQDTLATGATPRPHACAAGWDSVIAREIPGSPLGAGPVRRPKRHTRIRRKLVGGNGA